MKKYIAELIGTFALTFVVLLSLAGFFPVSTPILAGLTLALFVYSIGNISGSHINPAVTLGALIIKKIKVTDAIAYLIAQCVGATLAFFVAQGLFQISVVDLGAINSFRVFFAELIGTFFFAFGIASFVYGNVSKDMSGIVIGGSLLLGITLSATLGANGVLNPAVALGIGSFNLAYALGPILGSMLGMYVFKTLDSK